MLKAHTRPNRGPLKRVETSAGGEPSVTDPKRLLDHVLSARSARGRLPQACIITHSDRLLKSALAAHPHTTFDIPGVLPSRLYLFEPEGSGSYAIVRANAGASMAVVLLEELIALGFRRFVTMGCAGVPANGAGPAVPIGGVVLANRALIYEGTSPHYTPHDRVSYPDDASVRTLSDLLTSYGIGHRVGAVATTDALYRETPGFLDELLANDVMAIDMELSALFTVARFRQVEMAGLLYISDVVDRDGDWQLGFVHGTLRAIEDRLFTLVLEYVAQG